MSSTRITKSTVIADPPLARFLFSDTRMAPVWLLVRIYVGWAWLDAGLHKIQDVGATTNYIYDGTGILAFWNRIAAIPAAPAKPVITYDWYRGYRGDPVPEGEDPGAVVDVVRRRSYV